MKTAGPHTPFIGQTPVSLSPGTYSLRVGHPLQLAVPGTYSFKLTEAVPAQTALHQIG